MVLREGSWERGCHPLPDAAASQTDSPKAPELRAGAEVSRQNSSTSLHTLWEDLVRRRKLVASVVGGLLLACLLYCLIAPNQYEATAKVALRTSPDSTLSLDTSEPTASASVLSGPLQQETLANIFRSDRLGWRVITELKLYQAPGFMGNFPSRFPGFVPKPMDADGPSNSSTPEYADAQAWLLERFHRRLNVQGLPRTMLIQVRFRCRDAALSANVVNTLIRAYGEQESESRVDSTGQASEWLGVQLKDLKTRVDQDEQRLSAFQNAHGLLSTPEMLANGQIGENQHAATLLEIDELGRQLVVATTDRILREAEYRSASQGDPELVVATDPHLQSEGSSFATALLEQIRARRSELEQEQAQLSTDHGPNFPRVVEVHRELQDLDQQKQTEDAKLVERFRGAWQTAVDREQLVRKSLDEHSADGMKLNQAAIEYALMRQEADRSHELYIRVKEKVDEAGLSAGIHSSSISVVDYARQPVKPVAPDLPLYMAITFFAGLWVAMGVALMLDSLGRSSRRAIVTLSVMALALGTALGQAPTPSTSGLPTGVARIPQAAETRQQANPKEAPEVWNHSGEANQAGIVSPPGAESGAPMAAPIGPGDSLEISEYRTPEFHTVVRVSAAGTVTLPMVNEIQLGGLDELGAAHAVEAALVAKGMLLHPHVSVLVTAYAGQDVSVLGEVARPGVYPYTVHHRLLDAISQASGVAPNAGRLVNIIHRSNPNSPQRVALDPDGADAGVDHNPELSPGDTVEVSRAGLVYVVGDVNRPGGFPVDPVQGLSVVQALTLAWGPTQNAATGKALLIREQKGGRTLTTLNLKRMMRGRDPDQAIHDRDILFVPDSMAKNLMNRSMESAIQSAIGVSIYSGLVYSQRY
jgi:polysaccharide export outer membrane protein